MHVVVEGQNEECSGGLRATRAAHLSVPVVFVHPRPQWDVVVHIRHLGVKVGVSLWLLTRLTRHSNNRGAMVKRVINIDLSRCGKTGSWT